MTTNQQPTRGYIPVTHDGIHFSEETIEEPIAEAEYNKGA